MALKSIISYKIVLSIQNIDRNELQIPKYVKNIELQIDENGCFLKKSYAKMFVQDEGIGKNLESNFVNFAKEEFRK